MQQKDPKLGIVPFMSSRNLFPSLLRHFSLFDEDFGNVESVSDSSIALSEDDKHVYVEANVPGLSEEEIEITFDKGVLWIKGVHKEKEEDKKRKYYYSIDRSVSYRLMLPGELEDITPDAELKDGILRITFDKKKQEQPKKINVRRS